MAHPTNAPPSGKSTILWVIFVLAAIGAIWYFFLGPGVGEPWPWEAWLNGRTTRS